MGQFYGDGDTGVDLAKLDFFCNFKQTLALMTRIFRLTLVFWGTLFSVQCKNNDRGSSLHTPITLAARIGPKSLVGVWTGDCCLLYSSELILAADSTFTFHDQGCLEQSYTQGKWGISNGAIWLTSFENFKQKVQVWPSDTVLVPKGKGKHRHLKEGGPGNNTRVYFDGLHLRIERDTLYGGNTKGYLERAKFYRKV